MKVFSLLFILCIGLAYTASLFSDESSMNKETGTVVVTYRAPQQNFKLDRIHFWLINENQEHTLYPKKNAVVTHSKTGLKRTVAIRQLPAGRYTIKFLFSNHDDSIEEIPPKEFDLEANAVVKIDQEIKSKDNVIAQIAADSHHTPTSLGVITINNPPLYPYYPYPYPIPAIPLTRVDFSVTSNRSVEWRLMHNGLIVHRSIGSISTIPILANLTYYLIAEELPGHTLYMTPQNPLYAEAGRPLKIELFYQRDTGFLEFESLWSSAEPLKISVYSMETRQLVQQETLYPKAGRINFTSQALPTGEYKFFFKLPESFIPVREQSFWITKGLRIPLNLHLQQKGHLQVSTDSPAAHFTLVKSNGAIIGEGEGQHYNFPNLEAGLYSLNFSSTNPQVFAPPASQQVIISPNQTTNIQARYQRSGKVYVSSYLDSFKVTVQDLDTPQQVFVEVIPNRAQTLYLPEGRYRITFQPEDGNLSDIQSKDILVKAFGPQSLYFSPSVSAPTQDREPVAAQQDQEAGVLVISNLSNSQFTIRYLDTTDPTVLGPFLGKSNFIPLDKAGKIEITFESIPNYETPDPIVLDRTTDARHFVEVAYTPGETFVEVPAGDAIIGDPFSDNSQNERPAKQVFIDGFMIGIYEVTNAQFAQWLTEAFEEQKAFWNPNLPGQVIDEQGHLLCRTLQANPLSQIISQKISNKETFSSLPGKENYPVIEVSWYGAQAYCRDYQYRLPTENEWEKAAGTELTEGDKPKRFKYGFSQDEIDRTWANYKLMTNSLSRSHQVLTTPVGFYNGINTLPLTVEDRQPIQTHDAKSPTGAYDMSGNVWEWVETVDSSDPSKRIVKGGCYDSLADGVRVSERLSLPADYADSYTGFRVAKALSSPSTEL